MVCFPVGSRTKELRAHIFMLLDKPVAAPLLKQWLTQKNHEVPLLHDAMKLTKTGNAISWPLDISACQNDKLIYIRTARPRWHQGSASGQTTDRTGAAQEVPLLLWTRPA